MKQSLGDPQQYQTHYTGYGYVPSSTVHSFASKPPTGPTGSYKPGSRNIMALRINTGEYLRELSPPPSPTHRTGSAFEGGSRRVRLWSVWARTRFFQKLLMLSVTLWITLIVYKAGIFQHLVSDVNATLTPFAAQQQRANDVIDADQTITTKKNYLPNSEVQ